MADVYDAFLAKLRAAKRVLVASHYSPDGDAIGSTIALGLLLRGMGKEVLLYNRDGVPGNLAFLPGAKDISTRLGGMPACDLAVMVDCAQRTRISDKFAASKAFADVACIDHHLLERPEATELLVDSEAASTGEVVLRLARRAGLEPGPDFAMCIYTTLVVDTGFFKYSNTSAESFALAAKLVQQGAKPWAVARNLEESYPLARMRLLALALATLDLRLGGGYATMDVTQKMLADSGAAMDLSDEFAVFPRSIEGVEVSALFRQMEDGLTKVSLRSKDVVDVAALARAFGGGGHARAAGFRVRASMVETKRRIGEAVALALAKVGDRGIG